MAWRIVWSDSALDRVTVFLDFIAEENPAAARRVIQTLFDRVDTLADFPYLGRERPRGPRPRRRACAETVRSASQAEKISRASLPCLHPPRPR
jgi:plasmid stabilization system protein ParE